MRTITKDKTRMMEEIRKLISEGHTVSIKAKGYSMNPGLVQLRDSITLGPWDDSQLKKGCVALVKDLRGEYLVHRIIAREGDMLTLAGDGNVGLIEKASTKDVIGIMHGITRKGRDYNSDSFIWKAYSWLWMFLMPVRRWPLGLWRRLNPQPPLH